MPDRTTKREEPLCNGILLEVDPSFFDAYAFIRFAISDDTLYSNLWDWEKEMFADVLAAVPYRSLKSGKAGWMAQWIIMVPAHSIRSLLCKLAKTEATNIKRMQPHEMLAQKKYLLDTLCRAYLSQKRGGRDLFSKFIVIRLKGGKPNPAKKRQQVIEYLELVCGQDEESGLYLKICTARAICSRHDHVLHDLEKEKRPGYLRAGYGIDGNQDDGYFFIPLTRKRMEEKTHWYLHPSRLLGKAEPELFLNLQNVKSGTALSNAERAALLHQNLSHSRSIELADLTGQIARHFKPEGISLQFRSLSSLARKLCDDNVQEVIAAPYRNVGAIYLEQALHLLKENPLYVTTFSEDLTEQTVKEALDHIACELEEGLKAKIGTISGKKRQKEFTEDPLDIRFAADGSQIPDNSLALVLLEADYSVLKAQDRKDYLDPYLTDEHLIAQHIALSSLFPETKNNEESVRPNSEELQENQEQESQKKKKKDKHPSRPILVRCMTELVFKHALCSLKDPFAEKMTTLINRKLLFVQPGKKDEEPIGIGIDFGSGVMELYGAQTSNPLDWKILEHFQIYPEDLVIFDLESEKLWGIASSELFVLPQHTALLEFAQEAMEQDQPGQVRNKQNDWLIEDLLDLHLWHSASQPNRAVYCAGMRRKNMNSALPKASRLKIIHSEYAEEFTDFLPLILTNQLTSDDKLLTVPYPFKYLTERRIALTRLQRIQKMQDQQNQPPEFVV